MPVKQLRERFIEIWRKRTDAEAVSDERVLMRRFQTWLDKPRGRGPHEKSAVKLRDF